MKIFIILFLISNLYSIDTLTVYVRPEKSTINEFEQKFIKKIIKLYNSTNNDKYVIKFRTLPTFKVIYYKIANTRGLNKDFICAIRGYTIRQDKRLQYSYAYLPVETAVISKKGNRNNQWRRKSARISFWEGSSIKLYLDSLQKIYGFRLIKSSKANKLMDAGITDYYVSDSIDAYMNQNHRIVEELNDKSHLGIIYPKASILKEKLDPYIKYYTKSPDYYKLLKKSFGSEFSLYIKNHKD